MTVTVKSGSADASRTIGAYQTSLSWTETEVTWKQRRNGENWPTPGGDYGSKLDDAVVSNTAGTKVTFDVTPLVKAAVAGQLGSSRYTRDRADRPRRVHLGLVPRIRRAQRCQRRRPARS